MDSDSNSPISGPASVSIFRIEKPTNNIPGKSLIPFLGPINEGVDIDLESPSVSNPHPAADKPGVEDMPAVAGLNTGDAAAFNSGNSSDCLPDAKTYQEPEYVDIDGYRVFREVKLSEPQKPFLFYPHPNYGGIEIDPERLRERAALDKAIDSIGIEPSPSSDNPRIFFADEPRPSIWNLFSSEVRAAIERFAHDSTGNDPHEDGLLASQGITLELAHDSAAGWHDTNPIVRVEVDGNEWFIEFEEGSASEASGNEDDSGSENYENEDGSRHLISAHIIHGAKICSSLQDLLDALYDSHVGYPLPERHEYLAIHDAIQWIKAELPARDFGA